MSGHTLPFTSIQIPMPAKDLITALITVLLFLPVVVIVSRIFVFLTAKSSSAAKKKQ